MNTQSLTERQRQISDAVSRRESAAMDHALSRQILGQWPGPLPADYLTRIDEYTLHAKSVMAKLEQEVPNIDTQPLKDHRVVLYKRWKTLRSVLFFHSHPINDLPMEILINIFRLVAWSTMDPMVGVQARLTMSWVCRLWRQLVLDDTTLWSAVWFRDPPPYDRSFAWFDRAGTAPLSVRINDYQPPQRTRNVSDPPPSPVLMTAREMSDLLDRVFDKLSQIDIFIVIVGSAEACSVVVHKLNEAGRRGAPINMRRFELHRSGQPLQWMSDDTPVPLFGGAMSQHLTFFAVNGVVFDWNQTRLANLTTLDIRRTPLQVSPSTTRFREIMVACPNLQKLVLDGSGPSPGDPQHLPPVRMANLHTLVLGDFSCAYVVYILTTFVAPHVRDLTIMNLMGEDYSGLFNLMAQYASFPEVKILTLYTVAVADDPLSEIAMRHWFQTMPDVQYLRIAQIPSHLLLSLCRPGLPRTTDTDRPREQPIVLCPRCDVIEFQNMDCEAVARWVRGRRGLGVPPQSIYINSNFVSTNGAEIERALRPLQIPLLVAPLGNTTPDEGRIIANDDRLFQSSA